MYFNAAFLVAVVALAGQASSAIIKIIAQADYDKVDPFEFVPNEVTAALGDTLEFHFAGPGKGVLGGNHSVAQGVFGAPCKPAPNAFYSGYMPVNATSREADMIFLVNVTSTDPMPFYCTQGTHCTRGMHGVINGAGKQTLQSYRDSISVNRNAVAPATIGGGEMVANNVSNILPAQPLGAASSVRVSVISAVSAFGLALLMT